MSPILQIATLIPLAGDGILGTINELSGEARKTAQDVTLTVAVIGVVVIFLMSRFSLMKTVIAALVAGLVVWTVYNVTTLKDRVDGDLNSAPAVSLAQPEPPHQPV